MLLAAMLAPFGAVVLSMLLAAAVCYATVYQLLHQCLFTSSAARLALADEGLRQKSVTVSMLGLHVEGDAGAITVQDQQHTHCQAVLQLFRSHGYRNNNAYTTFSNPEMRVLLLPGVGCMVHTTAAHWGLKVVVAAGDPICEPQHDLLMLQAFKAAFPAGALMDVSKEVAELWAGQEAGQPGPSMTVTDMGTEIVMDVQSYHLEFNKRTKENRRNADKAAAAGLIVEELSPDSAAAVQPQVQQLAKEWQGGKEVTGDLKVFSRIIPFQHLGRERDARVFIARTLQPWEAAPFSVATATRQLEQQKAAAAAATCLPAAPEASARMTEGQQCTDSNLTITCFLAQPCGHQHQKQQKQRKHQKHQTQQQQETANSSGSVVCTAGSSSSSSSGSGNIHACVILDPIYRHGEVVGYLVQRTFLAPWGARGAAKLVLREVLGLLKAEGRAFLSHGPAAAHNVKPGAFHGFSDCAWLHRAVRLCWEYGNSFYAFQNLAVSKSSWGGGYDPATDSLKFSEAVTLNRRFVLLPPSWRCPLGHGPLLLLVMFRHVGVIKDPWELFAFWRYW